MVDNTFYYDLLLENIIDKLDKYPCKKGGEGTAYFVDGNFVVKKYDIDVDRYVNGLFDGYCKEMQRFNENGIRVPKIYTWAKIPRENKSQSELISSVKTDFYNSQANDYYILEEYISDRQLFYNSLGSCYNLFKHICPKDEFNYALKAPESNYELYHEIVKGYVNDFALMNEYLTEVPIEQIDEFLYNSYVMFLDGKYSMPDLYSGNIMINSKNFSLIDNKVKVIGEIGQMTRKEANSAMFSGIINMFHFNNFVTNSSSFYVIKYQDQNIASILNQNRDRITISCKSALIRMLKRMNEVCGHPVVNKNLEYNVNYSMLEHMLSTDDADEIYSTIEAEKE